MLAAIRQWVIRTMMKAKGQTGVVQTLPKRDIVEINTQITAQKLMQNGIDPEALKNANQVENAIIAIENKQKANLAENIRGGIRDTKSAKVFDLEGKEIKNPKNIMGGKEVVDVEGTVKNITSMEPVQAMKEANKVIRREGKYKNLSQEDSKKILTDSEDWIFQRDPDDLYDYKNKRPFRDDPNFDPDDPNYDAEPADFDPDADNETFAQGGRAGFFMGSPNPKGLGLLRQLLNFFGKKSDVIKNPSDVLRVSNPKAFNKMLEDAKGKVMPKEGIMATDAIKDYQTQMAKDRVDTVKEMLERGKRFKVADNKIVAYKNEVKERLMKQLNMSEEAAEKAANNMATLAMDVTKMEKTPKITDEGLLQLENVLKNMETGGKTARELNADGGRIGFKDGMSRRTFLKLLGGLASIPIVGKLIKPLKLTTGVKKVPIIKTDNVPGKPEWFDALVNKVIIEGSDVTKKFATGERQSIHQKTLKDGSVVRVTEDIDDGAVRVEYDSDANMFEDTVQMEYKKPLPDEGNPRPSAEFKTAESGIVGRADGPDDYSMDVEEVGGTSISDLDSDVSKLKEYATGKKLTIKELSDSMKRKKNVKYYQTDEGQVDYVTTRQGDYDPGPEEFMSDDYDFASGGIARMLGE